MRRKVNNLISVIYSFIRLCLLKVCHWMDLKFYFIERISPNVVLEMNRGAKCELGEKVRIHSGSKIKIRNNAKLFIGDNVKINYNCMFVCRDQIEIQEGVEFGPNVLIYDHDHDYRAEGGLKEGKYRTAPVSIGKNSWIGAGTTILRGTKIGKNCVIAAGCVIKGSIPDNSLVIQERTQSIKIIE